ncbi:hypothetical protein UE98_05095 [Burkholderia cenocepacia]|nr:hypothetical protein UE98_05095 [Burkholderia cenocepacia]
MKMSVEPMARPECQQGRNHDHPAKHADLPQSGAQCRLRYIARLPVSPDGALRGLLEYRRNGLGRFHVLVARGRSGFS